LNHVKTAARGLSLDVQAASVYKRLSRDDHTAISRSVDRLRNDSAPASIGLARNTAFYVVHRDTVKHFSENY